MKQKLDLQCYKFLWFENERLVVFGDLSPAIRFSPREELGAAASVGFTIVG